ncbi:Uncharacterized protein OBRU01_05183 [Operophtera brumata]|uniref:Conserved oligomeric Golgi complex subunit 3 n=1 Tax=Operophtera brumata TaxID=104452 RepID=A0A0L7LMY5_OPEBR|nr:Uncharacterized protein OBRU01_05183 [Operophtera brumata]
MDNMSLKEIQSKLLLWESSENPLAPLTSSQREAILDLESLILGVPSEVEDVKSKGNTSEEAEKIMPSVDNTYDFLEWYESLCDSNVKADDGPYEAYYKQLEDRRNECVSLTDQIGATMSDLDKLSEQYNFVSNKTNALHMMSEQLLADQNKLSTIVEHLSQRLNSPTMSVNSEAFFINSFKESHTYLVKYRHLQNRAISLIRSYANHVLDSACDNILSNDEATEEEDKADTAYAVYFGKDECALYRHLFAAPAPTEPDAAPAPLEEYLQSLCTVLYETLRPQVIHINHLETLAELCVILRVEVIEEQSVRDAAAAGDPHQPPGDAGGAVRHPARRGHRGAGQQRPLYETLRPQVIHINHLETLAELCVILRIEVIEEQVNNDPISIQQEQSLRRSDSRNSMVSDISATSAEVAHINVEAQRRPQASPADLHGMWYPGVRRTLAALSRLYRCLEKKVFQGRAWGSFFITAKLQCINVKAQICPKASPANLHGMWYPGVRRTLAALSRLYRCLEKKAQIRPKASPADLHGMWYPGVHRTLAALSRLYRCLEKKVFQAKLQLVCINVKAQIRPKASPVDLHGIRRTLAALSRLYRCLYNTTSVDGELFQIKHLLILREQIAPFQVDFIVKETTLDFSNMRNAAYGLMQKPRQIFSMNSNNALLEFLLEGTPTVREHLLDSRKEVDRQLKSCCESFIRNATEILVGPMIAFMEKPATAATPRAAATPEELARVVQEAQRHVKAALAPLQRSMQLYLSNKETEFILFRPIRNNVVGYFMQIEQLLVTGGYSSEDKLIVACPTAEQVSVFISSASLISHSEPVQPYGVKAKSVIRKPSVHSIEPLDVPMRHQVLHSSFSGGDIVECTTLRSRVNVICATL